MLCEDKLRLLDLYKDAASVYSIAVSDLTVTRGKTSKEEHTRLLAFAEKTRTASQALHREFLKHTKEHGCARSGGTKSGVASSRVLSCEPVDQLASQCKFPAFPL
jgi:hypothetical protein